MQAETATSGGVLLVLTNFVAESTVSKPSSPIWAAQWAGMDETQNGTVSVADSVNGSVYVTGSYFLPGSPPAKMDQGLFFSSSSRRAALSSEGRCLP